MIIIAVDDERIALAGLLAAIREAIPDAEIYGFEYPEDALSFAKSHHCNVAFLDVELCGMHGVSLAKELQQINRNINIIFSTGYDQYRKEALDLYCSGYITKPITAALVKRELNNLRHSVPAQRKLRVQTFGNFEVYYSNIPLKFRYNKTKELLAYLIDRRGALCTNGELNAVLFPESINRESYLRNLRKDLVDQLKSVGCSYILIQQRGKIGILPNLIDCDYYDWLCAPQNTIWNGEYMSQYSWAEDTSATLTNMFTNQK